MANIFKSLPAEVIRDERLKGALMSIYFRWLLIAVIIITLSIQMLTGYKSESIYSIILTTIYFAINVVIK